ncbi:hypothetical protein I6A60_06005 [Frankia sp. AgB1.9]|uniref:hypothetical protein n=1 Tax=unclassified Frankia TaxID=2632575 RepID=UPI0019313AA7|nr:MULTISPECIES: hypothetical protein [unclassified Frankia]MBL7547434.1 hypothetical protein [Frankia sp. AgB1.9]
MDHDRGPQGVSSRSRRRFTVDRLDEAARGDGTWQVTLRVRWLLLVPDDALTAQTADRVDVSAELTRTVVRTCYEQALSLIDVHSHPGAPSARLSAHDRRNALTTHREFLAAIPPRPPVRGIPRADQRGGRRCVARLPSRPSRRGEHPGQLIAGCSVPVPAGRGRAQTTITK